MAWERRKECGPYYCRSVRVGGRVTREYVGKGVLGELAATLDAQARARRAAAAGALRAERQRGAAPAHALGALIAACRLVAEAALRAEGYHQHDRGSWRRRHERRIEA